MAFNEKVKLLFIEHMRRVACGKVQTVAYRANDTNAAGQG